MSEDRSVVPTGDFLGLEASTADKPVDLLQVARELDIVAPHQKAEDLVGQTFTIYGARWVPSTLSPGDHYYFCRCVDPETGEKFTTSLGGQAVVDVLDGYFGARVDKPITIKLGFVRQGSFEGYYVLEPLA